MSHKLVNLSPSVRNDLIGELTPHVFESGAIDRPQGPNREGQGNGAFQIAPWLPVAFQDEVSNDWFVLSTGKLVCLTSEGHVAPAQYRADAGVTYTSDDFDEQTQDITTGLPYAVDGTTAYSSTDVRDALRLRGLIESDGVITDFFSRPVGALFGDAYQSFTLGDSNNPTHLKKLNYSKAKDVMFVVSSQMKLPLVPAIQSDLTVGALAAADLTLASTEAGDVFTPDEVRAITRYEDITSDTFLALSLGQFNIAKNTSRTPITSDVASFLVKEKFASMALKKNKRESIAAAVKSLKAAGDWFIDLEVGMLFFFSADGATLPAAIDAAVVTFYSYNSNPASVERYACATSVLKPGDWVKCDSNSNFTKWVDGTDDLVERVGRVFSLIKEPVDLLSRVQTAWPGESFGVKQKMTGSASEGYTTRVRYSNAADTVVHIVLQCQN